MSLFSRKEKEVGAADVSVKEKKEKAVNTSLPTSRNLSNVLLKPRITEKAMGQSERNVYTFVVSLSATKYDVADAIKAVYNVTPVKVNIVNKKPRRSMSSTKGRAIKEKGQKKAYVYLKSGDSISLV